MSFTPNHSAQTTSSTVVNTNTATLKIDGSTGEGGGQIIRTALSLSMLTGIPIEITNIRARRAKPGLMRQHLMCVQASQSISNATVTGAALGSAAFRFAPNAIKPGEYHFDIGSAGSTSLVLQTLLPALLFANTNIQAASTVTIKGGTHNPLAPTTDFLQHAFVPALAKLGMQVHIECLQAGFAPIGGGVIKATITPFMRRADSQPLTLTERGALTKIALVASVLNLEYDIGKRELASATATLIDGGVDDTLMTSNTSQLDGIGEGNSCSALVTHKHGDQIHQEMFTLLGEKRTSAEKMGNRLAGLVKRYLLKTDALVDEYLTDQLLLPLALSGGGEFTARVISQHTETQAWLIEQFLPVDISFEAINEQKTLVRVIV
ncbi:MAG: RNA 3'-terminal phosphate cyclase [Psychrobacter sp.]|uniref:RNA 3'-terminal phosphate cyclase n=1 Tax=unclassified Psychrobacter TaxID=196806 RepID=UPI00178875F7|nr:MULTISPECIES: RNA 3'-terminal phosphate cyclase [unclassified Psychrobacter]MBE0442238.1 RNA 3'-terminal phosphate cyclase [Psychrobacter sp. FME13]